MSKNTNPPADDNNAEAVDQAVEAVADANEEVATPTPTTQAPAVPAEPAAMAAAPIAPATPAPPAPPVPPATTYAVPPSGGAGWNKKSILVGALAGLLAAMLIVPLFGFAARAAFHDGDRGGMHQRNDNGFRGDSDSGRMGGRGEHHDEMRQKMEERIQGRSDQFDQDGQFSGPMMEQMQEHQQMHEDMLERLEELEQSQAPTN